MNSLLSRCGVLLALVATGVVGVPAAVAEEPPEKLAVVEEMAQAMGFASSHSTGFWEALTQAIAEQRVANEERAAAERAEQARQVFADAAKNGRRVEQTWGPITLFQEYIPPASGDIVNEQTQIRTGEIVVEPSGKATVITKYWDSSRQVGIVASVVEDGVETVTKVIQYEPDAIDVKVGESRPVPAPGSSAAGKKPNTIDPKADGSLGQASGGTPLEEHKKTATTETIVRRATGDSHTQFDPIKLPDGRVITPFVEDRPNESLPYRSGYELENADLFGKASARITVYFGKDGKAVGVIGSAIMDGLETIVAVEELKPGALGGVKLGDSRPAPANPKAPSTWDPKQKEPPPGGSSDGGRTKADAIAPDASGDKPAADDAGDKAPADGGQQSQDKVTWASESATDDDGNTYTAYEVTHEDGSTETGVQTERPDGTTSCKVQTADGGEQDAACPGGRTDEPTCSSSCAHLEVFFGLLGCADVECGTPPEGMQPNPGAGPDSCDSGIAITRVAGSGRTSGSGRSSASLGQFRDCTNADAPGGPADYGDPADPFGPEPVDPSQPIRPADDGVTDPVNPGETEDLAPESIRLDMHGTLRDPANPPGSEDTTLPGGGRPTTGEAERWVP